MKNIFKISFYSFLFVGLVTTSCSDATDIIQKGEATEDIVYQTVGDLQLGLNGVYRVYNPGANSNGNGDAILFNDLFTDNIKTGSSYSGHGIQMYQFNLQASSYTPESIWANRYTTINYANRVLRAANNIESTLETSEVAQFNHIKAQLLTWRAIAHYDIFMYFTPDYQNPSSLSAIIMDYVPEILDKPARNTAEEVIEFIFNDLNTASDLIAAGGTNPFFINSDVIDAFKAKLALATGDYDMAGQLATELLAKYPLADRLSYIALFEDLDTSTELIFGLSRVRGDSQVAGSWYANATNINGSPLFEMSKQLYDLFEPGDVRIDEVLLDDTSQPENDIYLIDKYPGSEQLLLNDLKIVRSSEMAFILAEVQARSSDFAGAATTLTSVTDARYNGPGTSPAISSFSNLNDALNRVLLERRKELCFEGHRYLDIKRIGREINAGIERYASDAATFSSAAPTSLPANDYRFTLPIPQAEINGNRNVDQNPTYTNN